MDRSTPALLLENVGYTYAGSSLPAIDGVSIEVARGERLGVLGPNGGGKSTLLRLVLGLLEPTTGQVRVMGLGPAEARRSGVVGYLPQRVDAGLDWPLSVRQVVEMSALVGHRPWRGLSPAAKDAVDRSIDLVGMSEHATSPIGALSGGQVQRAMIARAVAHGPEVLLLDEPMVGVDVVGQRRFGELVARLHDELGLTVVTVSHDLATVAATSDRVACLRRTLHFHNAPEGLTPQVLADVFSHDVESVFGAVHVDAHEATDCHDPSHTHTPAEPEQDGPS